MTTLLDTTSAVDRHDATPRTYENLFSAAVPKLQIAWDSVSLGLLKECARKYYYVIIQGWQPSGFAAHLAFGLAYHKALETYDIDLALGLGRDEALLNAIRFCMSYGTRDEHGKFRAYDSMFTREPAKTRDTLLRSVVWYLEQFKNDAAQTLILSDGSPAVELTFKINLDWETPDGNPFLLCGHLDRVVTLDDAVYFMDRKTTKGQIGSRFWRQFTPNNQMSLYYAATQLVLKEPARGGIIDAVELGATYARFGRHIIHRTVAQQAEWLQDTYHWLGVATQYATEEYWPMNDKSCSNYGGCPFQGICSKDPKVRETFLQHEGFHKRQWNPLESR